MTGIKYVSSTVVMGPHGPCVTRGYTDIGGMRIYDDVVVVGRGSQREISPGWTEFAMEQKPLGEPFQSILDANRWELYER